MAHTADRNLASFRFELRESLLRIAAESLRSRNRLRARTFPRSSTVRLAAVQQTPGASQSPWKLCFPNSRLRPLGKPHPTRMTPRPRGPFPDYRVRADRSTPSGPFLPAVTCGRRLRQYRQHDARLTGAFYIFASGECTSGTPHAWSNPRSPRRCPRTCPHPAPARR